MNDVEYQKEIDKQNFIKLLAKFFTIIGFIILLLVFTTTTTGWGNENTTISLEKWTIKSNIGSFVGGIVGSLFSLSGFLLIYLTFLSQKQSFEKERFESKFFDLLKLHRENVNELNIGDRVYGRKCFVQMHNEFKCIYNHVILYNESYSIDKIKMFDHDLEIADFCFKVFFFGVGYHSEIQLFAFLNDEQKTFYRNFLKDRLSSIQRNYDEFRRINKDDRFYWAKPISGDNDEFTMETDYYPFDGHSVRLGHYYRHLYQIVKFVDKQKKLLPFKERYFYLKTLRAQLSNHEQLMLYYDSLSQFGYAWHHKKYFITYSFLKNLPLPLVNIKPHPHDIIGVYNDKKQYIFEWDHIQSKNKPAIIPSSDKTDR